MHVTDGGVFVLPSSGYKRHLLLGTMELMVFCFFFVCCGEGVAESSVPWYMYGLNIWKRKKKEREKKTANV